MATNTSIEWAEATWNPLLGCTRVSPGCDSCYAINTATIRAGNPHPRVASAFAGLTERRNGRLDWTGRINLLPERLEQPLRWRKARRIFVNSQSDLFHDQVPDDYIAEVFAVMALASQHTFQLLTKRHGRMRSLLSNERFPQSVAERAAAQRGLGPSTAICRSEVVWPLPNLWLGVSVEDQKRADLRVPALLHTPAAVRWLSCEPLLGPVNLQEISRVDSPDGGWSAVASLGHGEQPRIGVGIDWVIVGGESGPAARPMHPDWARSLRDQCTVAGVPFFYKQHGEWEPLGPLYGDLEDTDDGHMGAAHLEAIEGRRVIQLESDGYVADGHQPGDPRTWLMGRVGKKAAGRQLDGRTWDEYPQAVAR